jgi:hypothetical protein
VSRTQATLVVIRRHCTCRDKTDGRDQLENIIRSLIAQLAWSADGISLAEAILKEYKDPKELKMIGATLIFDEFLELLQKLIKDQGTLVVIDALDQCCDPLQLLLRLSTLSAGPNGSLRFIFSSRPNVDVPKAFPSPKKLDLDASAGLTEEDMMEFVRSQVIDREELKIGTRLLNGKRPDLEERLIEVVAGRAQGM